MKDRVGLGWRRELAVGILENSDRIDLVEVIAEDFFEAPARARRALRALSARLPVVLHGVSLGLASCTPVERARLDKMARLVAEVQPVFWSEHLAFVRAGGVEIGHLAAPPRTPATVAGAAENLQQARAVVGSMPLVENIATFIVPPGSRLEEGDWVAQILAAADADLLLDLHNLYANALNHGYAPMEFLARIPPERVGAIHLAGGKWVSSEAGEERILDDHLHDVPGSVYDLLAEVAARAPRPLSVILERDGHYPPIGDLLGQLDQAREALTRGRNRQDAGRRAVA